MVDMGFFHLIGWFFLSMRSFIELRKCVGQQIGLGEWVVPVECLGAHAMHTRLSTVVLNA